MDKKDTWTITVEMTVFAGDMERLDVMDNTDTQLSTLLDGTDFMSVNTIDAKRNE